MLCCQQCFDNSFLSHRGLHTDKVELETNRSGYSLDPAITYTALITSQLGQGVSREFTIPNIKAGADLSVASYQTRPSHLPSSLVIALIVSLSFSVLVIAGSLLVFLLSQTWSVSQQLCTASQIKL